MHWSAGAQVAMGVSERPFVVTREGDRLPGILWMPEHASGPVPLVLIGREAVETLRASIRR